MATAPPFPNTQVARRRWLVTGQVQGVGFRPFVCRLARENHLSGFVRNDRSGVTIEAQGDPARLDHFAQSIRDTAPALLRISSFSAEDLPPHTTEDGPFVIAESPPADPNAPASADITVDTAVCDSCLDELFSRVDRRHYYGLINCTECGPRYSIIKKVPYDRVNTTMASFAMCHACSTEYHDPVNRRFHAQPTACHECGPKVSMVTNTGVIVSGDPYVNAVERLVAGEVIAIKGLGGFHLAVRADQESAVQRLRKAKHREHKPLAVMCSTLQAVDSLVHLSERARLLMESPACPIVLARRKPDGPIAPSVARGCHRLAVMLPYTPIQHMLFRAAPSLPPLVMTSANHSDEPLVTDNADALARLADCCSVLLWHDRPIARGVDDSLIIDVGEDDPIPVRRARGYVPTAIDLPVHHPTMGLSVGGELKSTVAVVRNTQAILSQHLGDLTHPRAYHLFRETTQDMCSLFHVRPHWVAHDLHPMYLSSTHAQRIAEALNIPLVGVQHHHAHAASVMAENRIPGPVLAIVCDGTGFGPDHTTWGGELLAADLLTFKRLARLRPLLLPGGDAAATDPRRSALAFLHQAYGGDLAENPEAWKLLPDRHERAMLTAMLRDLVSCVPSSGAGRVFDAVSALLGICPHNFYEAQAAMALEAAADGVTPPSPGAKPLFALERGDHHIDIDLAPLLRHILERLQHHATAPEMAALFHEQFARAWDAVVADAVEKTGLLCVALSGGVFCNTLLTRRLTELLQGRGLHVIRHRLVPPNDGGLALGQAAIAAARASKGLLPSVSRKAGA